MVCEKAKERKEKKKKSGERRADAQEGSAAAAGQDARAVVLFLLFLAVFFSLLDAEVLELPRVLLVDLLLEEEVAAVERRPVGVLAVHVAEVVGADLHDAGVLDLLGLDNT